MDMGSEFTSTWIFGSEGRGLTRSVINKFKPRLVKIPHRNDINSLNVASAVSICLFEMARQRHLNTRN